MFARKGRVKLLPCQALLAVIVALHLLLGLGFGLNTPLFESPDEPGHYLFVRYLQAFGRLPVQTAEFMAARAHHPPGYYALAALLSSWVPNPGSPTAIQMAVNPHFGFRTSDPGNDNKAYYVHNGPEERWPYQGQALVAHLARLVSLLFSTLAVLASYGAARALRPADDVFALFTTGLIAFNPMVLFMSGLVNNDTAALAVGASSLYLLSRCRRHGFTLKRWVVMGVAVGVGVLLKTSALVLLAPVGLVLLDDAWQRKSWRRRLLAPVGLVLLDDAWQRKSWRRLLLGGLGVALPVAALAGWWFVRNINLYGDPLANNAVKLVGGALPAAERLTDLPARLAWFFDGLLGCGPIGPGSLCFPAWVYGAAAIAALAGVAGALRLLVRRKPASATAGRAVQPWPAAGLWLAHAALILGTLAAAISVGFSLSNGWQGRYLFPAYTSLAIFLAAGWLAWFPARWRALVAGATLLASLALSSYALLGLLIPRYGLPPTLTVAELRQATPLDAHLGDVARVLAYRVEATTVHPGGVLAVTVYWQALARTAQPYTVFAHLYSPTDGSITQRDTYPGLGNYPTTGWDLGRSFADTYRLYLPADAPAGPAMIVLGLYDEASGQRLPVTGADAGPAAEAWVQFGTIIIR